MKQIIIDLYKILYKVTRAKNFSIYGAIAYVTILNLITIQGLGQLLEGWLKIMRFVRPLFSFPNIIITALVIFSCYFFSMRPFKSLKKERQKPPFVIPLLIYTMVCVVLFIYMKFGTSLYK